MELNKNQIRISKSTVIYVCTSCAHQGLDNPFFAIEVVGPYQRIAEVPGVSGKYKDTKSFSIHTISPSERLFKLV
ncbi:MAG: hypothetical protein J6M23_02760 [Bacteroidales bacterium]|nr:hypothetical protein [Bacteroidales bacterium]